MTIEDTRLVTVINRDNGHVGYKVPDLGIQRDFSPKERKEVTFEELRKLSYISGGEYILENCLVIEDREVVAALLGEVEPEYFYTENEVRKLLLEGSLDQLQDCLDFAPEGTVELVKDLAVKLEIQALDKREAIRAKTGFNVSKAIEINKETSEDNVQEEKKERRAPLFKEDPSKGQPIGRRTALPDYKVIAK